jgi:hypothetical protein
MTWTFSAWMPVTGLGAEFDPAGREVYPPQDVLEHAEVRLQQGAVRIRQASGVEGVHPQRGPEHPGHLPAGAGHLGEAQVHGPRETLVEAVEDIVVGPCPGAHPDPVPRDGPDEHRHGLTVGHRLVRPEGPVAVTPDKTREGGAVHVPPGPGRDGVPIDRFETHQALGRAALAGGHDEDLGELGPGDEAVGVGATAEPGVAGVDTEGSQDGQLRLGDVAVDVQEGRLGDGPGLDGSGRPDRSAEPR